MGSIRGRCISTFNLQSRSGQPVQVAIHITDITKIQVDAIVNAANNRLAHGGGVAAAIAKAAGDPFNKECQEYIQSHGNLKVTQTCVTRGGYLPCYAVIHVVAPDKRLYKPGTDQKCYADLATSIQNILITADRQRFQSIAIPAVSSGKLIFS